MAYKKPTSRKTRKDQEKLNLIPILDAVFIFIFFLLMSTQFVKIFEISSDIPIISNKEPPKKNQDKILGLTLKIHKNSIIVSDNSSRKLITVKKNADTGYDIDKLHEELVKLKQKHITSKVKYVDPDSIILEPIVDVEYDIIVKVMDAVRKFRNTDDALFRKDKDGIDVQLKFLFNNIIFGNISS